MSTSPASKVLFIGLVWPEPTSSAAGYRILQLVENFAKRGYQIHFASAAQKTERSSVFAEDVFTHDILLNEDSFNEWIKKLQPQIVVYDRFMIEEQYGWRVRKECPHTITILDTEDLHFVRKAREMAFKKQQEINFFTDDAKRELASILRCDLSLIISKEEMKILESFQIPTEKLVYLPFSEKFLSDEHFHLLPSFTSRNHFCFIGNFLHEPNYQTVLQLKKIFWPRIKKILPHAEIHIYGAYPTQKIWDLDQPQDRFYIKGSAACVSDMLQNYRVMLAPIPFGAGIKGKFVDGAKAKIPNVTTSMGAESMYSEQWNGFVCDDIDDFVNKAILLYTDEMIWNEKVKNGQNLINIYYADASYALRLFKKIDVISQNVQAYRNAFFIGEILFHQQMQASKYLSLWIMEKNK